MTDFNQMSKSKRTMYIAKLEYKLKTDYLVTNEVERSRVVNDYSRTKKGEYTSEQERGKQISPFALLMITIMILDTNNYNIYLIGNFYLEILLVFLGYMVLVYIVCPRLTANRILTYRIRSNISLFLFVLLGISLMSKSSFDVIDIILILLWIRLSLSYIDLNRKFEEAVYKQREAGILQKYKLFDYGYKRVRAYDKMTTEQKHDLEQLKINTIEEIKRCNEYHRSK